MSDSGGYTVVPLLSEPARAALLREALRMHASDGAVFRAEEEADDRGAAARFFESAPGGPALGALYRSPTLATLLTRLTGAAWRPLGEQASYSFYREEGHFLGLHRDIVRCEVAVIPCLHDDHDDPGLTLWPSRADEPLSAIRAEPERGRVPLTLRPGEAVVLLGGVVPHAVDPLPAGRTRVTAPMCFQPS